MDTTPHDYLPQISEERCTGCGLCVTACPDEVLRLEDSVAIVGQPERCTYTAACQDVCPTDAISLPFELVM